MRKSVPGKLNPMVRHIGQTLSLARGEVAGDPGYQEAPGLRVRLKPQFGELCERDVFELAVSAGMKFSH